MEILISIFASAIYDCLKKSGGVIMDDFNSFFLNDEDARNLCLEPSQIEDAYILANDILVDNEMSEIKISRIINDSEDFKNFLLSLKGNLTNKNVSIIQNNIYGDNIASA